MTHPVHEAIFDTGMTVKGIQTIESLRSDLRLLGVRKDVDLIVHASLRSIGKVQGGYRNVLESLLRVVGSEGTILAPAFNYDSLDPARFRKFESTTELKDHRDRVKPFDVFLSPSQEGKMGDIIRLDTRGSRSNHPIKSWAAIGARAFEFTKNTPLDDCDGLESPIGRLYQHGNGQILLIGVDHNKNTSIHLAESLAGLPHYINSELQYKDSDGVWRSLKGCGECSNGFHKVRGIIDFTKYEVSGKVGNALTYLIDQKPFVDDIVKVLLKTPWSLLCDNPYCGKCNRARKFYGLDPLKPREYRLRHPWAKK